MPWTTPTLRTVREMVRGEITAALSGASFVGNSVLRVMADAKAGMAHLVLRYIDWLARQFLPDTAETEWLDRHGNIWLVNADASVGRKQATYAEGIVTLTGTGATVVASGTLLVGTTGVSYETIEEVILGPPPGTSASVRALDPGAAGNIDAGEVLGIEDPVAGLDASATVVELLGGADAETDDELRARVLLRIRQPPMGGDSDDYPQWALKVPGVTRAWAAGNEMGVGTVTVRFMMDELRAADDGFPGEPDIQEVTQYLDQVRPVTVKELWVVAPIPEPINFTIANLDPDDSDIRARIAASVEAMIKREARPSHSINGVAQPAQTIYAAWVSAAVLAADGVVSFDLVMTDHVMPNNGALAVMGTVTYT